MNKKENSNILDSMLNDMDGFLNDAMSSKLDAMEDSMEKGVPRIEIVKRVIGGEVVIASATVYAHSRKQANTFCKEHITPIDSNIKVNIVII